MSAINNADIFRAFLSFQTIRTARSREGHGSIERDKLRFLYRCYILADYSMYYYALIITLFGDF